MTKGWLVYNDSLVSKKYKDVYELYIEAANQLNVELIMISNKQVYIEIMNDQIAISCMDNKPDFVLFLDKDIALAKQLELFNYRVFNSSKVIELCDNKASTLLELSKHQIKIPKTIVAPLSFNDNINEEFNNQVINKLGFPMVIKESFGSFGMQVYLVNNKEEFLSIQKKINHLPHIYQEFIQSSYGKDVRIYVSFGKVVLSILRTHESDFRANVSMGGTMEVYEPIEAFKQMAIEVTKALNADFTGVDILFGDHDEPILCEVNSNSHIKNAFDVSGINVARSIVEGVLNEIGDNCL